MFVQPRDHLRARWAAERRIHVRAPEQHALLHHLRIHGRHERRCEVGPGLVVADHQQDVRALVLRQVAPPARRRRSGSVRAKERFPAPLPTRRRHSNIARSARPTHDPPTVAPRRAGARRGVQGVSGLPVSLRQRNRSDGERPRARKSEPTEGPERARTGAGLGGDADRRDGRQVLVDRETHDACPAVGRSEHLTRRGAEVEAERRTTVVPERLPDDRQVGIARRGGRRRARSILPPRRGFRRPAPSRRA